MPDQPLITSREQRALLRYSAVTYITECIDVGFTLSAALRRAAAKTWPNGHGGGRCYAERTIEDWWYAYQNKGFVALTNEARQDAGGRHTLSPELQEWIIAQREKCLSIPIKVAYERWLEQEHRRDLPSLATVYRFLKKVGLAKREQQDAEGGTGPKKAFEAPFPNDLWMADFSPGPKLSTTGAKLISTHLAVIIDDHSRLLPYAAYYRKENTETFHHTLKEAVLRRGVPLKLYVDNGAPFVSKHTEIVCANLGIRLLHHKPYRAWSKGKVERVIHTIQLGFETTLALPEEQVHTIEALNAKLSSWIQTKYHTRNHSSTGVSPQTRFQEGSEYLRQLELSTEALEKLFYTRAKRTVRKNGTIRLHNRLYEVDPVLRGRHIELRYNPFAEDALLEVYHENHFTGHAHLVDLNLNSQLHGHQNYERR